MSKPTSRTWTTECEQVASLNRVGPLHDNPVSWLRTRLLQSGIDLSRPSASSFPNHGTLLTVTPPHSMGAAASLGNASGIGVT